MAAAPLPHVTESKCSGFQLHYAWGELEDHRKTEIANSVREVLLEDLDLFFVTRDHRLDQKFGH